MNYPWKQAIIVGASSGVGAALARRLVAAGCTVAVVARRNDELVKLRDELNRAAGRQAVIIAQHDVHDRAAVPALFQNLARELGGLDLVAYVAGVMPKVAPDEYNTEKDAEIMEVNTVGAMAWINEAAQRFERVKGGTIIGVSSIAGDRGRRGNPAYCTSKAALNTYLESIRNRVARFGVKVLTAKPGFVDTAMTKGMPGLFWLISSDRAAEIILDAARSGKREVYVPGRWRFVGVVLRTIPSFIFRRLNV
jgi:NAD(P)-dependent dehydrogenase (short-subunit alcohol dehydrogenase family)